MKRYVILIVLLAGCASPQFRPTSDQAGTELARAEWECQQEFRADLNMAILADPQTGGLRGYGRNRFMRDCMRAKGYEVVK